MKNLAIFLILSSLITGALAEEKLADTFVVASDEGFVWQTALNAISPNFGKVASDTSVAFQAKCGKQITIGHLKHEMQSERTAKMLMLLVSANESVSECAKNKDSCGRSSGYEQYMSLATSVECT